MAKSSKFGFTNKSLDTDHLMTPVKLGVVTNYSVITDTASEAVLSNKTAPLDIEEIISYKSRDIARVDTNLNIQYPAPVTKGIQYTVMVEDTLSTTDSADASFRVDEPIVAYVTFRHGKSGNITPDVVKQVFERLISALKRADGSWRFDDLMRSAERPVAD